MTLWAPEQSRAWYKARPWPVGANFIPSTAINQLEMWQAGTFDPVTITRELGYAAALGLNLMRVFLHDLLWEQDADGFCRSLDRYLDIADGMGIKTLFVIFDDCWGQQFRLGPQPAPQPATHNSGWVQSPGVRVVNEPSEWPRLERYVTGLLGRFTGDPRIFGWDLYNEPGNGAGIGVDKQGARSLPLLSAAFGWARSVAGLSQPLTVGLWNFAPDFAAMNDFSLANSDIVTFHNYGPPQELADRIAEMSRHGRPVVCTEFMARGAGSSFEYCLPILRRHRVGAICWGLVAGKTQTIYPWGWNPTKGEPELWFHDIFRQDGRLLYPNEERAIRQATGVGHKEA